MLKTLSIYPLTFKELGKKIIGPFMEISGILMHKRNI